ncbi:MAG: NYN domain-containing protein [Microgenomates group bacterium]
MVKPKFQLVKGFRDLLPPKIKKTGKTAVFIDAANILYSQKSLGWQVNYKKLINCLKKEFKPIFVGFYYGEVKTNNGQQRFFQMLKDRGYNLCTKPVKYIKTPKGTILKGNLDIELAFDILRLKEKFNTCILFSGDSDFETILKYLKKEKKKVIIVSTKGRVAIELIRNCDKYINLKKLKHLLERK